MIDRNWFAMGVQFAVYILYICALVPDVFNHDWRSLSACLHAIASKPDLTTSVFLLLQPKQH